MWRVAALALCVWSQIVTSDSEFAPADRVAVRLSDEDSDEFVEHKALYGFKCYGHWEIVDQPSDMLCSWSLVSINISTGAVTELAYIAHYETAGHPLLQSRLVWNTNSSRLYINWSGTALGVLEKNPWYFPYLTYEWRAYWLYLHDKTDAYFGLGEYQHRLIDASISLSEQGLPKISLDEVSEHDGSTAAWFSVLQRGELRARCEMERFIICEWSNEAYVITTCSNKATAWFIVIDLVRRERKLQFQIPSSLHINTIVEYPKEKAFLAIDEGAVWKYSTETFVRKKLFDAPPEILYDHVQMVITPSTHISGFSELVVVIISMRGPEHMAHDWYSAPGWIHCFSLYTRQPLRAPLELSSWNSYTCAGWKYASCSFSGPFIALGTEDFERMGINLKDLKQLP